MRLKCPMTVDQSSTSTHAHTYKLMQFNTCTHAHYCKRSVITNTYVPSKIQLSTFALVRICSLMQFNVCAQAHHYNGSLPRTSTNANQISHTCNSILANKRTNAIGNSSWNSTPCYKNSYGKGRSNSYGKGPCNSTLAKLRKSALGHRYKHQCNLKLAHKSTNATQHLHAYVPLKPNNETCANATQPNSHTYAH